MCVIMQTKHEYTFYYFWLQICVHRILYVNVCSLSTLQALSLKKKEWFNELLGDFHSARATDRLIDFQYNLQRKHKSYELILFIMRSTAAARKKSAEKQIKSNGASLCA